MPVSPLVLSVVIPCPDEERFIADSARELVEYLDTAEWDCGLGRRWEIIIAVGADAQAAHVDHDDVGLGAGGQAPQVVAAQGPGPAERGRGEDVGRGGQITRLGIGETPLLPTHPEFGLTGLAVPSKIRATKLVTLSRDLLRRWLGRLGPLLIADLDRALVAALGINTAPYQEHGRHDERTRLADLHRAGGMGALLADLGLPATAAPPR